jgi:membrane protease YdiL (CAAX protease family)
MTGTRGPRLALGTPASGLRTVGLVLAALAGASVVDRAVPDAHLAVGLGLAVCLFLIAGAEGLTSADLGLARSRWPAGLRWGAAAAVLVGAAYALAYLIPAVRQVVPDGEGGPGAALTVVLVVPLGTVFPEELAFRGLLLSVLGHRWGVRAGVLLSSGLFGLWHVLASLGGGPANAAIVEVVGGDAAGTMLRVVVTVLFTSVAGVVLCWLRLRSGSLLAPILAHWTVNGLGVIVTMVA